MTTVASKQLSRPGDGRPAAPVRSVHLGLGNFFRSHQAWYTDRAPDASDWGIAAFTGRSAALAQALDEQSGLYTLISRDADGDSASVVGSVSATHPGTDHAAWLDYLRRPEVAVVTLTITEAGYARTAAGGLDLENAAVATDLRALRADPTAAVTSSPARLAAGLMARRAAGAGALAIVSCDNLPHNGAVVQAVVADAARAVDPTLVEWIDANVGFVTTMVDRITPATTDADRTAALALTGRVDTAPVVTEPYSEWVLAGDFPAGRPDWVSAGAVVVDDVEPFEQRKLWLLNGAHSLLAYAGSARGHRTIAEAVSDAACREWVNQWWDEAVCHLSLPAEETAAYRAALLHRFDNARIRHLLAQIAADGSQKIKVRILPVLRAERSAGRPATGAARVVAAWLDHLRGAGASITDVEAERVRHSSAGLSLDAARRILDYLDPALADDDELVATVASLARH